MGSILSLAEAASLTADLRAQGKIVVATCGIYDLFHKGHLTRLQEAKAQGDILIVVVNSDKSVKEFKSEYRPIIPESERMEILAALECVNYVVQFDGVRPLKALEEIKPSVLLNSPEYGTETDECQVVRKYGGKVILGTVDKKAISSTEIIKRIRALPEHEKRKHDIKSNG